MRFARPVRLSVLALLVVSGCRTAGVDNLARRDPPPIAPALDVRTVIADHNRNAERIETLEAQPELMVERPGKNFGVNGRMALERPRNFKLDLSHTGTEVADIGSNEEQFWFWIRDNKDKLVYYCNYADADNSAITATFQPDWIIEALGLRVIPQEEVGDFKLTPGRSADQLVLTHVPTVAGAEKITRVTIISAKTHRITEHQVFSGEPKSLIARAVVQDYMSLVPSDAPDEVVYVPKKLKLIWVREKMEMDVTFDPSSTKINVPFEDERRSALFVQGAHQGYQPKNLASDFARPSRGPTTVRETLPPPPTGVQLGQPSPLGVEGARRTTEDPIALSADLPSNPSLSERLVGPSMPKAPEIDFAKPESTTRWRRGSDYSFER